MLIIAATEYDLGEIVLVKVDYDQYGEVVEVGRIVAVSASIIEDLGYYDIEYEIQVIGFYDPGHTIMVDEETLKTYNESALS